MKPQATNLFEPKLITHKQDPETSFAAAGKMIKSGALSRQEKIVWYEIEIQTHSPGGNCTFTAKELSIWAGLNYHTIQRRLSGLCLKGKIERIQIEGIETHPKGKPVYKKRDGCCVWQIVR